MLLEGEKTLDGQKGGDKDPRENPMCIGLNRITHHKVRVTK